MSGSVALALVTSLGLTFFAIVAGAVLGRGGIVPLAAKKGISPALGKVCLPALLFHGMALTDLSTVPWAFFGAQTIAKLIVCGLVFLSSTRGAIRAKRRSLAKAGVFMLFTTRSAVWSLGLPIFKAIWPPSGPSSTGVDYAANKRILSLPFVCAPTDNLLIMPLALVLIQAGNLPADESLGARELRAVMCRVAKTPAVVLVMLGLLSTLVLGPTGLPPFVIACFEFAAAPYAFLSLFSIGLSLAAGTIHLNGFDEVRRPMLLISAKLLLLPTIIAAFTQVVTHDNELSYFGFLYGAMPTTAAVAIFAGESGVSQKLLTSSILWCTIASGPLLLVTGLCAHSSKNFLADPGIRTVLDALSMVALVGCAVCLLWGLVGKPLVRVKCPSLATCPYTRSGGLMYLVIGSQLATSAGVCGFVGSFCKLSAASATLVVSSYGRAGFVLAASHSTRIAITLLAIVTVQNRLREASKTVRHMAEDNTLVHAMHAVGLSDKPRRRGFLLAWALCTAVVAAVVGTEMPTDDSGCYTLQLTGGLKALSLITDSLCAVLLWLSLGALAKFRQAAAVEDSVKQASAGTPMVAMSTTSNPASTGTPIVAMSTTSNPGVPEGIEARAPPTKAAVATPDGAGRALSSAAVDESKADLGDRFGPLIFYEAALATTMFFGQALPSASPSVVVVLLLEVGLLQIYTVRALMLYLLYGPNLADLAGMWGALAGRLCVASCGTEQQSGSIDDGLGDGEDTTQSSRRRSYAVDTTDSSRTFFLSQQGALVDLE
jgi:predicted permease